MKALVLDASCGVKWVIPEAGSGHAHQLAAARALGEVELWAPDLYVAEVTSIVWKKCQLLNELSPGQAARALEMLLALLPELAESAPLAPQALELGRTLGISPDDGLYVALSLQLGCPLVTEDAKLLSRARPALGNMMRLGEAVRSLG